MKKILSQAKAMLNASKNSTVSNICDVANDVFDVMSCYALDVEEYNIDSDNDDMYTVSFDFDKKYEDEYFFFFDAARVRVQNRGYIISLLNVSADKMSFSFRKYTQEDFNRLEMVYNSYKQILNCKLSEYIKFTLGIPLDGITYRMCDNNKYCVSICGKFASKEKFDELVSIIGKGHIKYADFNSEENYIDNIEFIV